MNDKVIKFELDPKTLKVKDLLNKDFLELEIKAISTAKPNRNGSHFTLESLAKAIPSFYNKPILGSFSVNKDDFRGHEGDLVYDEELDTLYYDYTDEIGETPLGLIRGDDKVEVYHDEKDGLDWVKFTCAIWVKYNYKQVKKLLKSKDGHKKISVEVEVNDWEYDEQGIQIIKDFTFDGVTILGDALETGIADANLTILEMVESALFQKKQKCLCYAYKALDENEIPAVFEAATEGAVETQVSDKDFSSETVPNEGVEEIEMTQENQEGGEQKVLTYEAKRSLLERALNKHLAELHKEDNCYYFVWICDLTDNDCYFNLCDDYYRAAYQIIEGADDAEGQVIIDFDNKERVVRSWSTFEAKVDEEVTEDFSEGEPIEEESTHAEEPNEEDSHEEESCDETFEAEGTDPNEEPDDLNTEEHTTEEIIAETTESISAPEVSTETEEVGEANDAVDETVENEVVEAIADGGLDNIASEVSEGPAGETAEVVPAEEDEAEVVQPDDEEKAEIFEAVTVEVDGESLDINALFTKYSALKSNWDNLNQTIQNQKAEALSKFGANFINADDCVDEETKNVYIAQVDEKCKSFEFTTEEDVTKFAKGLLAMYYYENKVVKKENSEFSITIEQSVHTEAPITGSKLKNAIKKLNSI